MKRSTSAKERKFKIATADIETDPFLYGRVPHPFCCGFFDGDNYEQFWGDDCIADMMAYIDSLPDNYRIYVHNGGGFDFWYMQDFITNPVFFINKRIAKCGLMERHELRDSYKMIPVALKKFAKEEIDYAKLESKVRNKHKKEILHYLEWDCRHLYNMVTRFIEEYGDHLTIGAAAMKHLKKDHPNKGESQFFDALFRPYYMGGRVQCFQRGEVKGNLKLYDVNSLYPSVMRNFAHPLGNQYKTRFDLPDNGNVYFAKIRAWSDGALPIRTKEGLSFPVGEFDFNVCSHEILTAKRLGKLRIRAVYECREFKEIQNFSTYIDRFAAIKISAEEAGDKGGREFAKLFMNNGYGKFGQDPSKYRDCKLFDGIDDAEAEGYTLCGDFGDRFIGEKPVEIKPWSFKNVAIAASITSAARATLLDGIANCDRPIYCDTDSIVCERLDRELHQTKLGAWKLEAEGDTMHIAGRKLYALWKNGECVKRASKGVTLSPELIREVAVSDSELEVKRDAPILRVAQSAKWDVKKIRATA